MPAWDSPPWAEALREEGFDVLAPLAPTVYDAHAPASLSCARLLPGARVAWVVGSSRALFEHARGPGGSLALDAHTERTLAQCEAGARGARRVAVLGHRPAPDGLPDLVALGRAAGLGWPSRLGLLLHPEFGPWWSLRAVVLSEEPGAAGEALPGEGPCARCPAPCTVACPATAPGPKGFDARACGAVRAEAGPCARACAARSACPEGAGHAYPPEALAHVMEASREAVVAWARGPGNPPSAQGK